jgi:hypothetical protein
MLNVRSTCLVAALLPVLIAPALAQTAASGPSAYLRCDGNPPHRSTGELIGRALLLGATMGLAGKGETQDASKRAYGIDGVDACTAALQGESDPLRKVQLMLARSVHQLERGDFGNALDDARQAPSLAGQQANDIGFRHTLLVSSLQLQAAALARTGHFADAETAAVQIANAAPYEVLAQIGAAPYVQLTADLTPGKQAYLNRLVKIFPAALPLRATAYEWSGKYLEAAGDYADMVDLQAAFSAESDPPPMPAALALRSVMLALGGRMAESAALAANTSAMLRVLAATGKAGLLKPSIDAAEQALDFRAIVQDLDEGRSSAARIKFTARSRWSVPSGPAVAELATRLRRGAPAAELTGLLAGDPATLRTDALVANAGALTQAGDAVVSLYGAIRPPLGAAAYREWEDDVWNTKSSPFLHKREAGDRYVGELMLVSPPQALFSTAHFITFATGEALLMHSALMAQARGVKGFELYSNRQRLDAFLLRFGNPGDPGMPASLTFDAATVIAGLSPAFPDPHLKSAPQ